MRLLTLATLVGGLAIAGCSNEPDQDTVAAAEDGAMVGGEDGAVVAGQAMGDPQSAVEGSDANRVFFALDSAELTAAGRQQLDEIASAYAQTPAAGVTLAGFADTTGTRPYNQQLSEQRAEAVRAYLVERGIPAGEIEMEAHGQEQLLVDTGNNVAEPANRRVRIELGDQA